MTALQRLVAFSVRRRGVVLTAWVLVALAALVLGRRLSVDAVPDVTNTQVSVITSAPGLSPLEVEQYLTYPVEMSMSGVPYVDTIRSVSRTAVSAVTIVFAEGTDPWLARQLVSERLKQAEADIPEGYGRPELAPVSSGLGEIYELYLVSDVHTPMELRTMLDWTVGPKLRAVPGVVEVNGMGGEAKQFQVVLDPKALAAVRLSLGKVVEALEKNNASVGGGYLEKNSESYVIRADAQLKSVAEIEQIVLTADGDGTPVLVKHVGKVVEGPALRFGAVTKHGHGEIVAGTVMMLTGANSREVVHGVKKRLAEIQKELPKGVEIRSYYDRAEFIERMLQTVAINLAEGALLVVLVLFLTLGSFRGALIAALAIPLSMGIAVSGMARLGVTGNLMSLGAIDFGLLVDGCIVLLEASLAAIAARHLRTKGEVTEVVAEVMGGSAKPVAFSLLIILLVYLPLMALEGVEGKMFRPMAIAVALALAGALAFSLTAFPALAAFVLKPVGKGPHGGFFGKIERRYYALLGRAFARPGRWLVTSVMLVIASGALAFNLGAEFVPRLDEGELALDVKRLPSISISEAQRLGEQVEKVLARFPEVKSVVSRTGRAEVATDPVGPDEAEVMVKLSPRSEWKTAHDLDDLGDAIKQAVEAEVPATFVSISQPIEDRVNQLLAGSRADVVIKVYGEDLEVLKRTADRLGLVLDQVPGRGDLRVQRVLGLPLLEVRPDRARLARLGISADEVLKVVEASRVGVHAGRVFEGSKRFDLVVKLPPSEQTREALGELRVPTPNGELVPLSSVAEIIETEGPAAVHREALERRVLVEINVRGRDLVSFVKDAQLAAAAVELPPGVHLEWGGQFENFDRASARLGLVGPVALGLIFLMLFLTFGSLRPALVVFAGVPLALVGGVASLWLRGLPFSIPAAVGFIAVAGVVVLSGVVVTSEALRRVALGTPPQLAAREAAGQTLRAILTTALVAAVGFLPMALSQRAGAEVQRPLATVVIGGIVSAAMLSVVVIPILLAKGLQARRPEE